MAHFERRFDVGSGRSVKAIIYPPSCTVPNGDWSCEYQVIGLDSEGLKTSYGVDGIQAFILALTYISTTLYFSDEFQSGMLTWLGSRDLGLPIAENVREDVEAIRSIKPPI